MNIPVGFPQILGRQLLLARKHSPSAMFVAGVAGTVISTVLACRATMKLPEVLADCQHELDMVKEAVADTPNSDTRKDVAYVYAKSVIRMTRLYGPSFMVGAGSIGLLTGSHVVLGKRNAGLTAAYTALSASFDKYQARVRDEVGVDREIEIRTNSKFEEVVTEDGVKSKVLHALSDAPESPYARTFAVGNSNWDKNRELNQLFIRCQETYLNQRLHAKGHVFLNEAYDSLGLPRSKEGQIVGWLRGEGDNYIDFGLFREQNAGWHLHGESTIILDFNVDGIIYDRI